MKAQKKDQKWMKVYLHFNKFVNGKCSFGDVTVELCNKFRDYLLNAHHLKRKNQKISQNSAAGYFSTFRALLKIAYKEKFFRENLNDFLESIDTTDVKIEYLTLEEVKKLVETPCKIPILKDASLFSCLTGLRISDILNLEWKNIVPASEGGYCLRLRTEKTETETTLPISDEALKLCGERSEGKVFKGLKRFMVFQPLKNWVEDAGITKHITFHCFRHTYATLQIALGTDIYTVSKMLTHKNVSTTQIYADLVNAKKRESANKISLK
jgi:site-specific recombinase XerD